MIGTHHPVPGTYRTALDEWQKVPLDSFPRNIGTLVIGPANDLVHLVEKNYPVLFDSVDRLLLDIFIVDKVASLFLGQQTRCLADSNLTATGTLATEVLEHALQLPGHLLHAWGTHDFDTHSRSADFDFDLLVIKFTLTE